jgi:hypothetical protein
VAAGRSSGTVDGALSILEHHAAGMMMHFNVVPQRE